jgi:hypothetical protein
MLPRSISNPHAKPLPQALVFLAQGGIFGEQLLVGKGWGHGRSRFQQIRLDGYLTDYSTISKENLEKVCAWAYIERDFSCYPAMHML